MSRIAAYGAEGDFTGGIGIDVAAGCPAPTGTVTRDTAVFRTGIASFKCDSTGANAAAYLPSSFSTAVVSATMYVRAYIRFTALPGSTVKVLAALGLASANAMSIKVTSAGVTQFFDDTAGTQVGSDGPTVTTGTWYRFEISLTSNASSQWTSGEGRIDGVTIASGSIATPPSAAFRHRVGWVDAPGASKVLNIDDIAVNDATGSVNNTWNGAGGSVLLLPISDAQDGSWTGGAGGTGIDLSLAVKSLLPVGVASASATNTSQIESADSSGNNTTDEYRANLTTYTTAGVGASDTINSLIPIIVHGEDVTTNTKTGSFGLQANPAAAGGGAETTFTYGADAGAVGTYPSFWTITRSTITEAPSVTLGSSPVLAVRKTDAGTRVASVCFMGVYMDYTPAVAAPALVLQQGVVNFQDPGVI
jgi:hypothetical protein